MQKTEYNGILRWIQTYSEHSIEWFPQESTFHDSQQMVINMPETILAPPEFPLEFSIDAKQLMYTPVPQAVEESIGLFTLKSLISCSGERYNYSKKVRDFFDESISDYVNRLEMFCIIYLALKYSILQDICMRRFFEKNVEQMSSNLENSSSISATSSDLGNDSLISAKLPENTIKLLAQRFDFNRDQITEVCEKVCIMFDLQSCCATDSTLCVRRDVFIQSIPVAIFIALHMPKNEIHGNWSFNATPNLPQYIIAAIGDNFRFNTLNALLAHEKMENILLKCNYRFLLMQYIMLTQDENGCKALSSRDGGIAKYKKKAENQKVISVSMLSDSTKKKQKNCADIHYDKIDTYTDLLSVMQYISLYDDGKCRINDLDIFLKILEGCTVKIGKKQIVINQSANIMIFNSLTGYITLLGSKSDEISNFLYTHAIAQRLPFCINPTHINSLIIQVINDLRHCTFKLNDKMDPDGYFDLCENLLCRREPHATMMTDDQ